MYECCLLNACSSVAHSDFCRYWYFNECAFRWCSKWATMTKKTNWSRLLANWSPRKFLVYTYVCLCTYTYVEHKQRRCKSPTLCVLLCIHACMYAYVLHVCIHACMQNIPSCMHAYTLLHECVCIYVCLYVCIHIYVHVDIHIHTYYDASSSQGNAYSQIHIMCTHTYLRTSTYTRSQCDCPDASSAHKGNTCTEIYAYTYTRAYIYIYTYIYIHI